MKKVLFIVLGCISLQSFAQTTITIRPDAAQGKDALVDNSSPNSNYGSNPDNAAWAWTSGGITIARSLMQFDLSSIPSNVTITDARISLYCNTNSSVTQLQSGANASYLQRVTSSWDENSVTWNNQPTTTTSNQVSLAQSTSSTQNYTNIDVTQLVVDMYNNPSSSFGFMLRLQNEATYRTMLFASSDHSDSTIRPIFTVTYISPTPCANILTLRPNATQGKDALVDNSSPNSNYGSNPDNAAWAWTSGGVTIARSLIEFDLSSIPSNAIINTAKLSLYCNTASSVTQLQSGANASYLQRVTSSWDENSVTWNNQPTTTTTNQVSLAQSTSTTQNYTDIDITQLITDMRNNPTSSFGLMLKLQNEATYRTMLFASSDYSDSTKRPTLVICYDTPTPQATIQVTSPNGGEVWEHNSTHNITWSSTNVDSVTISYSLDNGINWNTIGNSSSSSTGGSYLWNIPAAILSTSAKVMVTDIAQSSISDISDAVFSITMATGIAEVYNSNLLNTYPNPAHTTFYIDYKNNGSPYSLRIMNLNGQLIEERINVTDSKLKIDNDVIFKNKGIYFIEIENGGTIYRRKIAIL